MKKNLFLLMLLAVALPFGFSACSSDDDNNSNPAEQEEEPATATDGLSYFQSAITAEDGNKNLLYYHYGEVLYDNAPEHLYIGADTWDEAKKTFRNWISGNHASVSETTDQLTATLKDEKGNTQLTVSEERFGHEGRRGHRQRRVEIEVLLPDHLHAQQRLAAERQDVESLEEVRHPV